jgi:hypothetical protein
MKKIILSFIGFCFAPCLFATTWLVGPSHTYMFPSQVSALVQDGDTVEIDAGLYPSDVAHWTANNLLLKGVGGIASLPSGGLTFGGKAIWVISGNNTTVEYIEFSQASCADNNGAGIRQEGKNLTVSHCYFHDNENGILAGTVNPSNILIEYTEFANNGYGDGFSHNLYINNIDTLTFRYNYSHHAIVGHELKSRAHVNFILYNRISDEATGTASRSIDLPNGGTSYLIGNIIEQGPLTQKSNIIGYGLEGLSNPSPHNVYAINNTFVNNRSGGNFFSFQTGTALFKAYNNIIAGSGSFVAGNWPTVADTVSNIINAVINSFAFLDASQYDYHLTGGSIAANNSGLAPGTANSFSLNPVMEYFHPHSAVDRCVEGNPDAGAYEYCASTGIETFIDEELVYPNPSSGIFKIYSSKKILEIEIFDLRGNVVYKSLASQNEIKLSVLPKGIYFIRVIHENQKISFSKLIFEE